MKKGMIWLLAAVTAAWLALLPLAIPSGAVTPEAQRAYEDEMYVDDEYAFLFEE
ncbi:MAG: hypothetical protein IJ461_11090 [Clostridia bacterium]|nr:hypothetical protein [Clostridia bacterium]